MALIAFHPARYQGFLPDISAVKAGYADGRLSGTRNISLESHGSIKKAPGVSTGSFYAAW